MNVWDGPGRYGVGRKHPVLEGARAYTLLILIAALISLVGLVRS